MLRGGDHPNYCRRDTARKYLNPGQNHAFSCPKELPLRAFFFAYDLLAKHFPFTPYCTSSRPSDCHTLTPSKVVIRLYPVFRMHTSRFPQPSGYDGMIMRSGDGK